MSVLAFYLVLVGVLLGLIIVGTYLEITYPWDAYCLIPLVIGGFFTLIFGAGYGLSTEREIGRKELKVICTVAKMNDRPISKTVTFLDGRPSVVLTEANFVNLPITAHEVTEENRWGYDSIRVEFKPVLESVGTEE